MNTYKGEKKIWGLISLVQKYFMGLTGLGLSLFLLLHMLGNLLVFVSAKSYNLYAHKLIQNPLLIAFEMGLLALFVGHIVLALALSWKNHQARPQKQARPQTYALTPQAGYKATPLYQKSLLAQGAVILVFVISHLITFKFGAHYEVTYDGEQVRDLFRLVDETFQNPWMVLWYLLALLILFVHLFHGLDSSFRSLGLTPPKLEVKLKKISLVYATIVVVGYVALPLVIFFKGFLL